MKRTSLLFAAAVLTACFSPEVSTETAMGSGGTDGGTGTDMTSGPADGSSGSGDPGSDTTSVDPDTTATGSETGIDPNDAPPQFESFTVNGSTAPAEVDEGGTIALEADVTDDMGVASVEFFDGDTSLGVVDAAPFELDVAVSSADSGAHAYSALATDTAGQTAQSEEVMLSINIVGGEVMFYRDNLFPGSTGIGGPGLAIASTGTGRVLVNGYVAGTATGRVQAFNDDLSSLWTDNGAGLTRARAADVDGQVLVSTWLDGSWTYDLRALDSSAVVDSLTLGVPAGDITVQLVGSRGTTGGDGLVLTTLPNTLASYSTTFAGPAWTVELADDAVITDLDPFGDGATLITFNTEGQCAPGAQTCLRRVEPNGDIAWTAGLGSGVVATVRSSGAVAAVATRSSGGVSYTELASNGSNAGPELVLDERNDYPGVPDVAADGAGGIVLVGTLGPVGDETAVATRFDANGELTWQQAAIATGPDSMGLGVSVYEDAAFVCGIENLETAGLSTNGDVFAAKLRL